MKKGLKSWLTGLLAIATVVGSVVIAPPEKAEAANGKITLNSGMVTNESGLGDATYLVDEQSLANDPRAGTGGAPTNHWQPGWNEALMPAYAYIDLGANYDLTDIYLRDGPGISNATVYAGSPGSWTALFTDPLSGYLVWNAHSVSVTTRYIRVGLAATTSQVKEIVVYGELTGGGSDTTAPAAISNLAAPTSGSGNVNLTWTSPGDDGSTGTAASYDIRYSTSTITSGNWASATTVTGEPTPAVAGTSQSYNVTGLSPSTTYYFAIRASDEVPNVGALSNVVSKATTAADTTAPAAISNLAAPTSGSGNVNLTWTSPGDDGSTGTAASYDIRYSTSTITTGNWASATQATGEPAPAVAGTSQSFNVTGLSASTTYYFAIRASDEVPNVGALSNVVSKATTAPPSDTTAPAAISNVTAPTRSATSVNLSWTSPGDDGNTGTATSYDIRYSTSAINAGNWASATQATGEPAPAVAGTTQTFNVTGLTPATTYYFAIRTTDEVPNLSNLSNSLSKATTANNGKITLDASMLIDEGVIASPYPLIDEPTLAGDPRAGTGGSPVTRWFTTNNAIMYPISMVIDLGTEYTLTDFYLRQDSWGTSLLVSTGTPFDWDLQFTDPLSSNPPTWTGHSLNVTTRYLQLRSDENLCCMNISEIVLYGTQVGDDPEDPPEPVAHTRPTMDQLIGINMLNDDPIDKAAVAGFVREYHNWIWDDDDKWTFGTINTGYPGYPNNLHKFNPSYGGTPGWNFDAYYDTLKDMGITVSPAIMGSPTWMETDFANKPLFAGEDANDPLSYAEHASEMFQFMARYGSTPVADAKLKLASDQDRLSGLDLVHYVENWNEQDTWWHTRDNHFKPYEYAAMTSADYDGHMGALSNVHGVKNADPNAKLVMGGIAYLTVDYLKAMKFWADFNRGGDVPFDVINVHQYSHDGYGQGNGTVGLSPEADNFKGLMKEFVDYRDQYMPGKEVWVTEFGYDTNQTSIGRAPAIGATSEYEVQGDWLVRTYLAAAAAGIDKAAQFMLRDVTSWSTARFQTMGLLTDRQSGFQPKFSWYAVYTLKNTLTGMRYVDEIPSGNPNVSIYRFKSATGNNGAYVLWSPTSNNTTVSNYQLTLAGTPSTANKVTMTANDTDGVTSALTISSGKVTLNVSERPVYVLVNDID